MPDAGKEADSRVTVGFEAAASCLKQHVCELSQYMINRKLKLNAVKSANI